ncbi:MAG: flavodoxin-dependent (E)-4-hydroxy-3-methylbut-2-enyl-diphosphate synthase [Coriobacteriales bacterium]|jgi:(E)-4-hydroxy-3-methylbut-2-enyl-diphosphate synthase|nr:flavodoxin-dependent (E)-4-hydroxy-3-methylbut-2-enyl-diphosphate synthase [Coriobacteriales bacterium]
MSSTRQIVVGDAALGGVALGGGAPVVVQSMLNIPTSDAPGCLAQIDILAEAGCELIRLALPDTASLPAFERICAESPLPVIADIHFDFRLAIAAAELGAAKLRINPGNIADLDLVDAIIDAAGSVGIPIRIGVNAGSLAPEFALRSELSLTEKLVASAESFVEHFEERDFTNIVVSAKAHDVRTTVEVYRLLAADLPQVPLHLGVTEAGTAFTGTVKSAAALGALLLDGIGDTIRVSLTADPVEELRVAWQLLATLGLRRRGPELVSCPTCGRCQVDLIALACEVEERLSFVRKPLTVAVMGCIVNGPGEAASADVGVACGAGKGAIFSAGKILYTVPESTIVDALMEEIDRY